MKRKTPPQTGFGFDDPPKTPIKIEPPMRLAGVVQHEPMALPSLADLLRKSITAPLVRKSDGSYEPKIGAPVPVSAATSIDGIGAETRKLYVKLAAKDGDWRAWHRLWPSVKPSPAMVNAFVSERAKYLEEQRAG